MKDVMKRLRGKISNVSSHDEVKVGRDDIHLMIRYAEEFEKLAAHWNQPVPKTQSIMVPEE